MRLEHSITFNRVQDVLIHRSSSAVYNRKVIKCDSFNMVDVSVDKAGKFGGEFIWQTVSFEGDPSIFLPPKCVQITA